MSEIVLIGRIAASLLPERDYAAICAGLKGLREVHRSMHYAEAAGQKWLDKGALEVRLYDVSGRVWVMTPSERAPRELERSTRSRFNDRSAYHTVIQQTKATEELRARLPAHK